MAVPIQVKIEDCPNDEGGERTGAQVSTESRRAGEKDGRVPQVELQLGKSSVQQPNDSRGQCSNQETEQDRTEEG